MFKYHGIGRGGRGRSLDDHLITLLILVWNNKKGLTCIHCVLFWTAICFFIINNILYENVAMHKPGAHFFMFTVFIPWKVQPSILTYIIPCSFCGDSCEKYRRGFQLDYPIHVKCRKIIPSMNVRIKKIWKNILPNTQVCKSVVLLRFMWLIEKVILVRVYM